MFSEFSIVPTKGVAMFKHKEDTLEPDDHALLNPLRWAEVVRLGQEGWELVSVQPLMRGVTEIGNQNAQGWAWGIALPVSYLLFLGACRDKGEIHSFGL
ncbi:hypothetical protein I5R75_31150 [Pseudomonas aeruginosa]|nr:hypothetical protein [Pseudomonas aeruginosa]